MASGRPLKPKQIGARVYLLPERLKTKEGRQYSYRHLSCSLSGLGYNRRPLSHRVIPFTRENALSALLTFFERSTDVTRGFPLSRPQTNQSHLLAGKFSGTVNMHMCDVHSQLIVTGQLAVNDKLRWYVRLTGLTATSRNVHVSFFHQAGL